MEDAEVKPSRRVWSAVSERVFGTPAVPAWKGWVWAGVAAASLALGLFWRPSSENEINEIPALRNEIFADLAPASAEDCTPSFPEHIPVVENIATICGTPAPAVSKAEPVAEVKPETVEGDGLEPEMNTVDNGIGAGTFSKEDSSEDECQPFNFEDEIVRSSGTVELTFNGAMSGNESDFNMPVHRPHLAPGVPSGPRTTVAELGDSSYGIPFTAGLGVRLYVLPRFSIGTGADYSMVSRTFDGEYTRVGEGGLVEVQAQGSVSHRMQYIGIPLNMYYDAVSTKALKFYIHGGGEAEFCVSNDYIIHSNQEYRYSKSVERIQWSVGAGVGVQFLFTPRLGVYLDPGVRYYFNCDQPKNVRTEHPLMFNLNAGFRINL